MDAMEAARQLGAAIQESPEYKEYQQFTAEVEADRGIKALVDEYKRLQSKVQLRMLTGQAAQDEDTQRFQQLSVLLFADNRTSSYLLAEMHLQKLLADLFSVLTQAAGLDIPMPL